MLDSKKRFFFFISRVLLTAIGLAAFACSSDESSEPPGVQLSSLSLFPDQLVMAVDDGFYLDVIAEDKAGNVIPNFVPEYTSSNASILAIHPDGQLNAIAEGTVTVTASAGGQTAKATVYVGAKTYDLSTLGPPRVLNANYIDLSKIDQVSRFRSTVGHSYVDGSGETCRSMKHYFKPYYPDIDWTTVDIYAPMSGTILAISPDGGRGYKVMLRPRDLPAMNVQIFHVNLDAGITKNGWLNAGDHIGRHASNETTSDIAVDIGGKENGTLLSYFETMTDEVFEQYQARGVSSRQAAIISKAERDADPVPCVGEQQFTVHGTTPDWLVLN
ncbi:MAG TPA: Ig-like domain-containing protein [Cyclobacteriaceae bacterium]|nr:Ig-like domain-containing protein [Cyclobacteriaceae bacterium]